MEDPDLSTLSASLARRIPDLGLVRSRVPLVPELGLWLLGADFPTGRLASEAMYALLAEPPYWAFCWASGAVLARWLLDHPESVRGKTVLDFGTGSGVVAIAAALAGASHVVACDVDGAALAAVRANARLNGVTVDVRDELGAARGPVDVLAAADVLYDQDNLPLLERFREQARTVLLADSRITDFASPGYSRVWQCECRTTPDLEEAPSVNRVNVYRAGVRS